MFTLIPRIIHPPEAVMAAQLHLRLERFLAGHRALPRRVEPDFIQLGNTLQAVHGRAEAMNRETRETMALLGLSRQQPDPAGDGPQPDAPDGHEPDAPDTMEQLRRLSRDTLHKLNRHHQTIAANLGLIETISSRLGRLAARSETLRKLGLHIEVVGLNIGVESTRSPAIRELFSGIAPELAQVAGKIRRVAGEIDDQCRREQREQGELQQTTARDLKSLKSMIGEAETTVASALAQIDRISSAVLTTMAATEQQSAEIARQLARVVMGIQLHDSMSQRIAHIVEALELAQATLQALPAHGNKNDRRRKLATAHHIIELQGEQVEKIIAETRQARRESSTAFSTIAGGVKLLQLTLDQLPAQEQPSEQPASAPTARADSSGNCETIPLSRLQAGMAGLEQLLLRSLAMTSRLAAGSRRTVTLTTQLNGHMINIEKIRNEIHLKALNTIIMSSQLGAEGVSMEVLAQETKTLSDLAHEFVGEFTNLHREISNSAQALQEGESGQPTTNATSLAEIAALFTRFNRQSAATGQQIGELSRGLNRAAAHLEFIDDLIADLETDRQILTEICRTAAPLVAGVKLEPEAAESRQLEKLYTMDRERELHRNALGLNPADEQQPTGVQDQQQAGKQTSPAPASSGSIELF